MRPELTSSQRALLRSKGRLLRPDAIVGKSGLAENVLDHVRGHLARRELVKVRLLDAAADDRRAAAGQIADALDAAVVDVVGRAVVLYRPNEALPAKERIALPDAGR